MSVEELTDILRELAYQTPAIDCLAQAGKLSANLEFMALRVTGTLIYNFVTSYPRLGGPDHVSAEQLRTVLAEVERPRADMLRFERANRRPRVNSVWAAYYLPFGPERQEALSGFEEVIDAAVTALDGVGEQDGGAER